MQIASVEKEIYDGIYEFENGKALTANLMNLAEPPTAIFTCNDLTAFGVINELLARDLKIPQDVSVVGFDNIEFSRMITPALTTIKQPNYDMGKLASTILPYDTRLLLFFEIEKELLLMKKLVLVGAGGRAHDMFAKPFITELNEHVEFVGIFDTNQVRARLVSDECGGVPVFNDFQVMLETVRPDAVVVASADHTHHTYIIAAMEAGIDVISEKPMTIDAAKCKAIIEAEKRTGKSVTVTFNLRFVPYAIKVKELLMEGAVGEIYHISLDWFLDRSHGADYFRRWHAQMEYSGGLLVHKATHHFDMLNWWLDSHPQEVHAFGNRRFYGSTREERGERCMTCNYQNTCEFYFDLTKDDFNNRYYVQAEKEDGYYRDQCVFGERINIYDNMAVNVKYESGALLNYSLVAYSPYEGWKATIHGSKGRMEVGSYYSEALPKQTSEPILIFKPDGELIEHHVPISSGTHGGSDEQIRRMIFVGDLPNPIDQQAGSFAGAMSLLIGAAANISIAEGKSVKIANLL